VLAAGLAAHLGIALQTQVAAEQTGLTQKGETLNEGVVDMLRDVVSSMKSDAGSDCFVGGNASADAAPLTSDASDNVVPRDMSMASSSASSSNTVPAYGAYGAYNAVPAMQANPLSMLTAFAVGNMVGSRAFGRNDWNNVWGNEWAVPRRPVLRPAQLIAPLQQTQIGRNAPIARQPVRSPAVPSNPPSRWTPPSGQHPQHQRSPAQQVPVSQQQPTILPDPQHVRRRA
jgi:hypothetical protein